MKRCFFPNGAPTLHRLQKDMDQIFGGLFNERGAPWGSAGGPAVNVWETPDGFALEAELPGFSLDELDVTVEGTEVVLRGERKRQEPEGQPTFHQRERRHGAFERRLDFPAEIDAGKAEAALKDGVLTLRLPKHESVLPKKVQIKQA